VDLQVKLFNLQDQGNHLIVLARGAMDKTAFAEMFDEVKKATQSLQECKVMVDLSDSTYEFNSGEIEAFVGELPLDDWPRGNKVAFVSASEGAEFYRLYLLRVAFVAQGLTMGVFRDAQTAIDWLAGHI
jgi:hypothetical protein